jgi:ParB/RepB/Spo0J family partition protein
MPRGLLKPRQTSLLARESALAEATEQIGQARYGQQLVLSVDSVQANPNNPRRNFDPDDLAQLAESLKVDGQIQPIVVRRVGDDWQLIAGERRWRAARLAGISTVAAVVREASDQQAFRLSFVENFHRKGLSQQEVVDALDELADMAQLNGLRKTAAELHMNPGWLSRQLKMRHDPIVFPALEDGRINFTQASDLLSPPAAARRPLLDRLYRERPDFATLRSWVQASRQEYRRSQQRLADQATGSFRGEASEDRFAAMYQELTRLGDPRNATERDTLGHMKEAIDQLLAQFGDGASGRRRPRARRNDGMVIYRHGQRVALTA